DMTTRDYDRAEFDAWADVDGDGRAELVAFGSRTVYVYSWVNGALIASGDVGWIPWAQAQTITADLDGAREPGEEIVIFTNTSYGPVVSTRQVMALDVADGAVTIRWQHGVADLIEDRHAFTGESVVDIDGDGDLDVVSSFYSAADGQWTTHARRGDDGTTIASVAGELVGALNVDHDAGAELLTRPGPGRIGIRAWDIVGNAGQLKWSRHDASWLTETDPAATNRQSLNQRTLTYDIDGDSEQEVVIRIHRNRHWRLRCVDFSGAIPQLKKNYQLSANVTFLAIKRAVLGGRERLLAARSDGYLAILDKNLHPTNEWNYPGGTVHGLRLGGYYPGWRGINAAPLAADLFGDDAEDLLVRDSRGALVTLDASGATVSNPPDLEWQVFGQRWYPALADTTGDGVPEVATGDAGQVAVRSASTGAALWLGARLVRVRQHRRRRRRRRGRPVRLVPADDQWCDRRGDAA
ncbi:MAG: hypothetical protein LC635_05720, partial [Pseudonocardiaceae bacterium]|nr:hypothetical protein [Pseudonocardiaceae bacterium]